MGTFGNCFALNIIQPVFIYSNLTMETPAQCEKPVQS